MAPQDNARRVHRPAGRPLGGPPSAAALHEAALAHLARFATTQAGLTRVLDRRIDRWARRAASEAADPDLVARSVIACRAAAREVAARLVASGAVDDAAFAASRARSLTRAGRSRRAVSAHLLARGVDQTLSRESVPEDPDAELAAAIVLARRRRLGPFRTDEADAEARRREFGVLARAGFPQDVAARALRMPREEAEERLIRLRQT